MIHFLLRCKGLRSAFTRGDGSGSVYAETVDLFSLRKALMKYPGGYTVQNQLPIVLTPEERVPALSFPSFQSPVGRWARVIAGTQLYKNDIVFIMDDSEYLAIPRVPYAKVLDTNSSPEPELFDAERFQTLRPGDHLVKRNMFWLWGKERRFQSGLEHRAWKPLYTTLENAVPSDRQRALFAQSGHRALQTTPFTGRCCALQEGDFVVVVAGQHTGRTGFIVVLTEMKQKDAQTKRDRLVRVAVVLERYNGTDAISKKSLESQENPSFAVAIQCLRLHVLSTPSPLSIDDRVAVVAGAGRGSSGRVESIGDDGVVTISVSGGERCQVEMRHVRRDFRVCDVVEIIRGPKKGTTGFVVEVHTGGFVVFYPVSRLSDCRPPRVFN
jgi:ribosomal protein L24